MIRLSSKYKCSGCTACYNICPTKAIKMIPDKEGFFYPLIDSNKCINCNKCEEVCKFEHPSFQKEFSESEVYAVKCNNFKVREKSQSGGAFSILTDAVLDKGGVVYGCVLDDNFLAVHSRAEAKSERDKMRGSKYIPSDLGGIFKLVKKDLRDGRYIVFTGTPCQIAGLRNYLDGENFGRILFLEILCNNVPSPKIWKSHMKFIEQKYKGKIKKANFRDKKRFGWESHKETFLLNCKENRKKIVFSDLFTTLFYSHYITRPSCYHCPFKNGLNIGDITIGDFWGIKEINPIVYDKKGVSLVLINNEKGKKYIERLLNKGNWTRISSHEWKEFQLKGAVKEPEKRAEFWEDYKKRDYKYITKKYAGNSLKGNMKKLIRISLVKIHLYEKYLAVKNK